MAVVVAAMVGAAALWPTPAAHAQTPFVADQDRFGRSSDKFQLTFCIDPRDPASVVDRAIGEAVATALLLEPKVVINRDPSRQNDLDEIYRHLLADCDLYFGFKLIPSAYPDWVALTRGYYSVGYVFVAKDPAVRQLADIPVTAALGPTIGTTGDFRLVQYLNALPSEKRWPRYPMGNDRLALQGVVDGDVAAALVWAPSFSTLAKDEPAFAALHVIAPAPLTSASVQVGAIMLQSATFLRSSVDGAIASLIADGTIRKILAANHFPDTP